MTFKQNSKLMAAYLKQINDMTAEELDNIITRVQQGAENMKEESVFVQETLEQVNEVSREAASSAEEVAASSQQQIASTEEIVSASEDLAQLSDRLLKAVNEFEID